MIQARHWQQLKSIIADALEEESTTTRVDFVRRSCSNDADLLRAAEYLLVQPGVLDSREDDDLEECVNAAPTIATFGNLEIGRRIGAYVILRRIGEGGMGAVYLADRVDGCFEKQVAIKFLTAGAKSEEAVRRFQSERQVLARLDHPNIARLIDAGTTDDGIPYFIMEYIDGIPVADFSEQECPSLRERLVLFLKIAAAVQAAHDHGIIHRDLKPSNILVNGEGEPKLLDFGIAKLLSESPDPQSQTVSGKERLSPLFASPEQAKGETVSISSDVYSLGIVLYQLLTGSVPFRLPSGSPVAGEILNAICNQSPTLPSQAAITRHKRNQLRGDLDAILLRALRKAPAQRYPSVTEFADDIQNHLQGTVVRTRSREKLYRIQHFLFRNKRARIGLAAAVVLFCIAGSVIFPSLLGIRSTALHSSRKALPKSIAVLPFDRFSSDDENRYLADGIQDKILTDLDQVANLRVIGRTSAAAFRANNLSAQEIGKALGVSYLLEGSLTKSADRIQINAKLIATQTGLEVWAQSYERRLEDLFALQSQLAQTIASQLTTTLSVDERAAIEARPTQDMEAYDFYLRARESFFQANWQNAVQLAEEAIARDRNFALAYCLVAEAHLYIYRFGQEMAPARLAQAKSAADMALRIAPNLAASHLAEAQYYYYGPREYEKVQRELAAVSPSLRDSAKFIDLAALTERRLGRWKDAIRDGEKALELDPHNPYIAHELVESYCCVRRFPEAEQLADKAIERLAPTNGYLWRLKSQSLFGQGLLDRAHATLEHAPLFTEWRAVDLAALDLFAHNLGSAAQRLAHAEPPENDSYQLYLLDGFIALARNDQPHALSSYQNARQRLQVKLAERPDDPDLLSQIGLADAGLGRNKEALDESRRAVDLVPVARDAVDGPNFVKRLAWVYSITGQYEAALDQLSKIVTLPGGPTATELRLDPVWDGLRSDGRFPEMVQRAAQAPVYE